MAKSTTVNQLINQKVILRHACLGLLIPDGYPLDLARGEEVQILQQTDSAVTIATCLGQRIRLCGDDIKALGDEAYQHYLDAQARLAEKTKGKDIKETIWNILGTCYDPEIPVSIVELGLIYNVDVYPIADDPSVSHDTPEQDPRLDGAKDTPSMNKQDEALYKVYVVMTLTAPGCGMGPVMIEEVRQKIAQCEMVAEVDVELAFDPPWGQEMMSDAAKLQLGLV